MLRCRRFAGGLVLPSGACDAATRRSDEGADAAEDSDDSDANEYAEGLGCADRKRCRERPSSGFAFDDVPREEYFEEPKTHASARGDVDLIGASRAEAGPKRLRAGGGGGALRSVLLELEREEARDGGHAAEDAREAWRRRKAAAVARRCEHRTQRRQGAAPATPAASGASGPVPGKEGAQRGAPQRTCDQRGAPPSGALAPSAAECRDALLALRARAAPEAEPALRALRALRAVEMTVALLRSTGLGVELGRGEWRRHGDARVARMAAELVAKWRAMVRQQKELHTAEVLRSAKAGA